MTIAEIIARLEKAEGPDGEIDAMIWFTVNRGAASRCYWSASTGMPKPIDLPFPPGLGRHAVIAKSPRYTSSIDAALMLVPKSWRLQDIWQSDDGESWYAGVRIPGNEVGSDDGCCSPAIALCIAALKARLAAECTA